MTAAEWKKQILDAARASRRGNSEPVRQLAERLAEMESRAASATTEVKTPAIAEQKLPSAVEMKSNDL